MTVLLAHESSDGTRRCDAGCHFARHARCVCICGGRFHGRGTLGILGQAVQETAAEFVEGLIEKGMTAEGLEQALGLSAEERRELLDEPARAARRRSGPRPKGRQRRQAAGQGDFLAQLGPLVPRPARSRDGGAQREAVSSAVPEGEVGDEG